MHIQTDSNWFGCSTGVLQGTNEEKQCVGEDANSMLQSLPIINTLTNSWASAPSRPVSDRVWCESCGRTLNSSLAFPFPSRGHDESENQQYESETHQLLSRRHTNTAYTLCVSFVMLMAFHFSPLRLVLQVAGAYMQTEWILFLSIDRQGVIWTYDISPTQRRPRRAMKEMKHQSGSPQLDAVFYRSLVPNIHMQKSYDISPSTVYW